MKWVLDESGRQRMIYNKGLPQPITPVNTMAALDQVASRAHVTHVRFAAQPTMTRSPSIWTVTYRRTPRAQA